MFVSGRHAGQKRLWRIARLLRAGAALARRYPLSVLTGLAVFLAIVFLAFPELDLATSALFHDPETGFLIRSGDDIEVIRDVFVWVLIVLLATSFLALALRILFRRRLFNVATRRWIFVLACFIIGPGLVANTLFKDNWGRPRPVQTEQFGGAFAFAPPLVIVSDACDDNCSFISGEGSLAFMTGFALLGLLGIFTWPAIALALIYGSIGAFMRIAMGGHYLSDNLFAAVFMAMIAIMLYRLIVGRESGRHTIGNPE